MQDERKPSTRAQHLRALVANAGILDDRELATLAAVVTARARMLVEPEANPEPAQAEPEPNVSAVVGLQ